MKKKIIWFKYNCFNLVFFLGKVVYYYYKDILLFFEIVYGICYDLLKVVVFDVKEILYLVGVKVFGLILIFIIILLWRLLEEKGYILDMNEKYKMLMDFL